MAHKTLVDGTAYNIAGGRSMISGTVYDIAGGRTLVGGTGYDVSFKQPVYAMLYSSGNMVFQKNNSVINGESLVAEYTDENNFKETNYIWDQTNRAITTPWYNNVRNIKYLSFKTQLSPQSTAFWFHNAQNLISVDYTNLNLNKTLNIKEFFKECHNLTGSPICGDKVIDITHTYTNCYNLTGSPVCGPNVTNMEWTYRDCRNLTGNPVCGPNVISMYQTYYNCHNLTGSPVCGPNVTDMSGTYWNCINLYGDMYINSADISTFSQCFYNRNVSNRLNIYIYNETMSLMSLLSDPINNWIKIAWTKSGLNYYNTTYNIYIYTSAYNVKHNNPYITEYTSGDVIVQPNNTYTTSLKQIYMWNIMKNNSPKFNMCQEMINLSFNIPLSPENMSLWFSNCINLKTINYANLNLNQTINMYYTYANCYNLIGSPACGPNVTNMYCTYFNCYNLTGNPVCGNNVINMAYTYYQCYNLTGSPVCSNNVTSMYHTYYNCYNLTGSPVCGNNVISMYGTYYNCYNLTGSPVCGNNVTTMCNTYYNCKNITGKAVCGNNVTNMCNTYYNCKNITGKAVCGNNVTNMSRTYYECNKINSVACGPNVTNLYGTYWGCKNIAAGTYYFYAKNVVNARGCFANKNFSRRLNIHVPRNSTTWNTFIQTNTTNSLVANEIVWTKGNSYYYYNKGYNIYLYANASMA